MDDRTENPSQSPSRLVEEPSASVLESDAQPQPPVDPEPDDFSDHDGDSAYTSIPSTSWSLTSSIMRVRERHGRIYHPSADYVLPNDEQESDRLDVQHHMFLLTYDGDICACPAARAGDTPFRCVLDIGTGTGIWAIDFADQHPESKVIGIDLSPIQPMLQVDFTNRSQEIATERPSELTFNYDSVPPNLRFYVDNVELPWTFSETFDFIHCRMMTGAIKDWPKLFENCFQNMAPGGWIELADFVFPALSDDGTLAEDAALAKWCRHALEAGKAIRSPLDSAKLYGYQLRDAGFVNVVEKWYKWPQCAWSNVGKYQELGLFADANFSDGLYGMSVEAFTRVLGWTAEQVQVFLVDVRKDIRNRRIHAYWPVHVVYAQKPGISSQEGT